VFLRRAKHVRAACRSFLFIARRCWCGGGGAWSRVRTTATVARNDRDYANGNHDKY
jgi:hypothetical protein